MGHTEKSSLRGNTGTSKNYPRLKGEGFCALGLLKPTGRCAKSRTHHKLRSPNEGAARVRPRPFGPPKGFR